LAGDLQAGRSGIADDDGLHAPQHEHGDGGITRIAPSARALAAQKDVPALAAHFAPLAKALTDNEAAIVAEFKAVQGRRVDIGGYCKANDAKVKAVMRPSATLNRVLVNAAA